MGQRGNYIIKEKGETKIYYTHWRANLIAKDLLLGENKFIEFVKKFEEKDELINYPWIEGFVIVDLDQKELIFHEEELLYQSSILEAYKQELKDIWKEWRVEFGQEGIYTLSQKVNSNYIHYQDENLETMEIADLKEINKYNNLASVLKDENGKVKVHYFNAGLDGFLMIGAKLLSFLKSKECQPILKESDFEFKSVVFIDEQKKKIVIGEGIPTLKEKLQQVWYNWDVEIEELGYLHFLKRSGIDTQKYSFSEEYIMNELKEIRDIKDSFDPNSLADELIKKGENVKFHSNFFENIKPEK